MKPARDRAAELAHTFRHARLADARQALDAAVDAIELLPLLVERIDDLEAQVRALTARGPKKAIACECLRCGKPFKVYPSEIAGGRKAGKFCSLACVLASRPHAA